MKLILNADYLCLIQFEVDGCRFPFSSFCCYSIVRDRFEVCVVFKLLLYICNFVLHSEIDSFRVFPTFADK